MVIIFSTSCIFTDELVRVRVIESLDIHLKFDSNIPVALPTHYAQNTITYCISCQIYKSLSENLGFGDAY